MINNKYSSLLKSSKALFNKKGIIFVKIQINKKQYYILRNLRK